MKRLILFLTCLSLYGYSQPKLGMSPSFTLNPAAALSSTMGVAYNSSFALATWVKNKGNATFNGSIRIILGLDTTGFVNATPIDTASLNLSNFDPNDSVSVTYTVTVTPSFRSSGNGNTIVVWPVSQGIQTLDSFKVNVYVIHPDGIEEWKQPVLQVYPNPAGDKLYITPGKNIQLKTVEVYDIWMRKVMECGFSGSVDLSSLRPGTYWIRASSGDKSFSTLIIKRE